jgi:lysophospholipase L1-like esterase
MVLERRFLLAVLVLALATGGGVTGASAIGAASGEVYVALGDSYTAGPLVPNQKGEPAGCARSDNNYPTLVAKQIAPEEFIDVSCSSAETKDMTQPQHVPFEGTNPPQFNALRKDVDLVTLGIGGNDMNFGEIAIKCGDLAIRNGGQGRPCTEHYTRSGYDEVAKRLREVVAPRLAKVIRGIQRRSPQARLLVVGYPDPAPRDPGCFPVLPVARGDLPFLQRVAERLSATVKRKALKGGAEYVPILPGSIGHDPCQLPGTKWYEGIVLTSPAYPAHPNALGMQFAARQVLEVLHRPVRNDFRILARRAQRDGSISLRLKAPARGSFHVRALARRAGKQIRFGRAESFAQRAGKLRLRVRPGRAGRDALSGQGRLRVSLEMTFRPIAGVRRTKRTMVTVRQR